jgi:hypothetical protein
MAVSQKGHRVVSNLELFQMESQLTENSGQEKFGPQEDKACGNYGDKIKLKHATG